MELEIYHSTRFDYSREVDLGPHLLYLRPRENSLMHVKAFELEIHPAAKISWVRDDLDNLPASALFAHSAQTLEFISRCTVSTSEDPPFDFMVRDYAERFPFEYESLHRFNLGIYLTPPAEETRSAVRHWLSQKFKRQPLNSVAWLFELNRALFDKLSYQRRDSPGMQTTIETLRIGSGACRDFAVALIDIARSSGLAARFVSGYIYDPNLEGQTGGDMHAWVEVYLPGAGWRGLDPTHGVFCHSGYVSVAHVVIAESVNPVQGSFRSVVPASSRLSTSLRVRRIP